MRHRIRAGALITRDDSVLLVYGDGDFGLKWWTPGGGVEGAETWAECARRETLEETGLQIDVGPLAYIYELVTPETDTHHFQVLYVGKNPTGTLRMPQPGDSGFDSRQKEVRFVDRSEITESLMWPSALRDGRFWADRDAGFPEPLYLGVVNR